MTTRVEQAKQLLPDAIVWLKEASRRMDEASVRLYAAAIAYRTLFSLIAFLSTFALMAYLLGIEPGEVRGAQPAEDGTWLPSDVEEIALEHAAASLDRGFRTAWIAGLIGFLLGLYTLASGFAALCDVLDRIHGVHEYRRMSRRYLRGAGVALLFLLFAIVAAGALLLTTGFGDFVFGQLGFEVLSSLWTLLFRFVIPMCAVVITFGFVLRYGSHARPPWREVLPGAAVGSGLWLLMFSGFLGYIVIFDGFDAYGALATSVGLLLFGYLQAYLIIGVAMFRSEIAWVIAILPGIRQAGDDGAGLTIHLPGGHDE
jgi:uncharacterized BrkB/YihY/UPF0761 family membrane protein